MARAMLISLLLGCAALAAQDPPRGYESNFGEVILASSDLIIQGTAGASRSRVAGAWRAEVTVEQVLYGECKANEVRVFYSDEGVLKKGEAVPALFALKRMAEGGFSMVGRPVALPDAALERETRLRVCREFVALEKNAPGEERTRLYENLVALHIAEGGYAAQNAAIELMFWVKRRPHEVTRERFDRFSKARANADRLLDTRTRADLDLALSGMVETRIKDLSFKQARRSEKAADRLAAVKDLAVLVEKHGSAFTDADARLADAMAREAGQGDEIKRELTDLARSIRAVVAARKAERESRRIPAGD
jgi:hypothetical protein